MFQKNWGKTFMTNMLIRTHKTFWQLQQEKMTFFLKKWYSFSGDFSQTPPGQLDQDGGGGGGGQGAGQGVAPAA